MLDIDSQESYVDKCEAGGLRRGSSIEHFALHPEKRDPLQSGPQHFHRHVESMEHHSLFGKHFPFVATYALDIPTVESLIMEFCDASDDPNLDPSCAAHVSQNRRAVYGLLKKCVPELILSIAAERTRRVDFASGLVASSCEVDHTTFEITVAVRA